MRGVVPFCVHREGANRGRGAVYLLAMPASGCARSSTEYAFGYRCERALKTHQGSDQGGTYLQGSSQRCRRARLLSHHHQAHVFGFLSLQSPLLSHKSATRRSLDASSALFAWQGASSVEFLSSVVPWLSSRPGFSDVLWNLSNKTVTTLYQFNSDVLQIFENCRYYNVNTPEYVQLADKTEKSYRKLLIKFFNFRR
eukprot:m.488607 g.488607  ORF g.488607 m.488607 type:complete len:197 (-) comp57234_c0_seq21:92-682(-)